MVVDLNHVRGQRAVTNGETIGVRVLQQDNAHGSDAMLTTYPNPIAARGHVPHQPTAVHRRNTERSVSVHCV